MKKVKGYKWGRKNKIRLARPAMLKAGSYAFRDRRAKKRTFRQLWNLKINAGARMHGMTYSTLIHAMKEKGMLIDRKILATLAEKHPEMFKAVIDSVK